MVSFSFNATAGASQSTAKPRLAGNNIYNVKFDGCEVQDVQGVKDPSITYKVIKLKFSNDEGTFEHTVFEPRKEDFIRTSTEYTDKNTGEKKSIPQASGVESVMLLFKHAIDSINPTIGQQIDNETKSLASPDWDSLRILVSKILNAGKGTEVQIKLLTNKKGDATFPGYFTGISKEGKAYIRNNFIGHKLAFSSYEQSRISTMAAAKPTPVDSFVTNNKPKADLDLDLDLGNVNLI